MDHKYSETFLTYRTIFSYRLKKSYSLRGSMFRSRAAEDIVFVFRPIKTWPFEPFLPINQIRYPPYQVVNSLYAKDGILLVFAE